MKNLKKIIYVIVIIAFILVFSIFSKEYLNNKSNTYENNENIATQSIELEEAVVTKVIDGDTIWVDINGDRKKVRFIGVNCPEYTTKIEEYGKEATEYTTDKLEGKTIYLQKDTTNTDSYDRLLRYVWLDDITEVTDESIDEYLFNAMLVKEGLAESNYYKPNIKLQNYLEEYEKQAKEERKGMWQ